MPATDLFPNIPATFNTKLSKQPRTLENTYGDGYEQRVGDGLNTIREVWSVVWEGILRSECDVIDAFLTNMKGYIPFMWTKPDATQLQVKCKAWEYTPTSGTTGNVMATFEQVFDL